MTRLDKIKVKEKFPISEQGHTIGKILNDMECQILLDMGVSKSFMFKSHYLRCKSLHSLPEFATRNSKNYSMKCIIGWCVVHYTNSDRYT